MCRWRRRDRRQPLAVDRRHVEPRQRGQVGQQRRARSRLSRIASHSVGDQLFAPRPCSMTSANGPAGTGFENVSGPPMTISGTRSAPRGALARPAAGMPGQVQAVDQAGQLQLVGQRERDDREVADRPRRSRRCAAARRRSRAARASSGRKARSALTPGSALQRAVDGLEPERRHPDEVRARVAERERESACLWMVPRSSVEAGGADVTKGNHGEPDIIRPPRAPVLVEAIWMR